MDTQLPSSHIFSTMRILVFLGKRVIHNRCDRPGNIITSVIVFLKAPLGAMPRKFWNMISGGSAPRGVEWSRYNSRHESRKERAGFSQPFRCSTNPSSRPPRFIFRHFSYPGRLSLSRAQERKRPLKKKINSDRAHRSLLALMQSKKRRFHCRASP